MIEVVGETGSTNADLIARLQGGEGVVDGHWLRAARQTDGKGRQGRDWFSPEGNLYASTVITIWPSDPAPHSLAFVASLAVRDTLLSLGVSAHAVTLKWPNDVLLSGAKACGILMERTGNAVVAGIGLNLAHAPAIPGRQTASVATFLGTAAPAPDAALALLAGAFAVRLRYWREEGLAATLAQWQERAHPFGTPLSIHADAEVRISGTFAGLAPDGALRLRLATGEVRVVHSGDVALP